MDIAKLKQCVLDKSLPGFVVFTGEEGGLIDMYINQIQKVYGIPFTWLEDVKSALTSLRFTRGITLLCIRGDYSVTKDESVWDKLKNTKGIIVLVLPKIKKNERFYKQFEDYIVEFERMNPQITIQLLHKVCPNISENRLEWLLNICGKDYLRTKNELEKLVVCKGSDDLFDRFASCGVFHQDVPDVSFDFKEAVLKRDRALSFSLLSSLQSRGIEPMMILGLLYNGFRNLASFMCTRTPTPNTTGLSTGVLYYQRSYRNYSVKEVVNILKVLFEAGDMVIKGILSNEELLEYVLVQIL